MSTTKDMSDLIERLRWYPKETFANRLMHEAADELERLDASRDRWIAQLKVLIAEKQRLEGVRDAAIPIADNGYAEESDITRLREALNKDK